jgi:hypothetical protein
MSTPPNSAKIANPIPITTRSSSRTQFTGSSSPGSYYNPFTPGDFIPTESPAVECPPAFLPRQGEGSQIQLDVFHHPAEILTPEADKEDPMARRPSEAVREAGKVLDGARSPVLAIHRTRPLDEDEGISEVISAGTSLEEPDLGPLRRTSSSVMSETTYVPMTPLPQNCSLCFFNRPREVSILMSKNTELVKLIEHSLPADKYAELVALLKSPRDRLSDEDWVRRTREYLALGPSEDSGGVLWTRWKELIGWEEGEEEEEEEEEEWNYTPQDASLHRQWSEIDRVREEATTPVVVLSEIEEGEEDGEDGERIVAMQRRRK